MVTCLVNAFLTVFIIIYPEWTFINMMATEPSILNGHRFGPFRRCFSRFTIGVEQTCDDYIAPFWQLPKSLLFIRTSLIVSAITIITATLTTLFSMSCVYQGQMNEASKTWLRLFNIFLRLSAGVLILLCVSLYATMVIHDDIRASDIQSLEPNTQPFRYEVYNLWGRCIWIGWAESCTEILLNLYALFAWMDPVGQAKKLEQKKADAERKKKAKKDAQLKNSQAAQNARNIQTAYNQNTNFHNTNFQNVNQENGQTFQNDRMYTTYHNPYEQTQFQDGFHVDNRYSNTQFYNENGPFFENRQFPESTVPEIDYDLLHRNGSTSSEVVQC